MYKEKTMADLSVIPKLVLDDTNDTEFVNQALARVQAASGNTITDFSIGSPARALIEGQVFATAELRYFMNMLPEATALEVFRLAGVTRNVGTPASGTMTFTLQYPINNDFVVNAGYLVPFSTGYFVTQSQLVIPAGLTQGAVNVVADHVGSDMNCAAYGVVVTVNNLAYLQSIYNTEPIGNGTDLEDLSVTYSRCQDVIRSHSVLVSKADYENAASDLLGGGKATCIPLLSSNSLSYKPGQVHLFLADANGQAPSIGTCQVIQSQLQAQSFVASSVWVSPVSLFPVTLSIVCQVPQISDTLAENVLTAVNTYLSPLSYSIGSTLLVNELAYVVRNVTGISAVASVIVNGKGTNIPLPFIYSTPVLNTLQLSFIQPDGVSNTYYLGTGTGSAD